MTSDPIIDAVLSVVGAMLVLGIIWTVLMPLEAYNRDICAGRGMAYITIADRPLCYLPETGALHIDAD